MISLLDYFAYTNLSRHEFVPVASMTGRRSATIAGTKIFVSPAMLHLIRSADSKAESDHLMKNIPACIIGSKNNIPHLQEV